MKSYQASNEFFNKVLQLLNEDCEEYTLYEGADILFFPKRLMGDNYPKMGMIGRETGRESAAFGNWKKAQDYVNQSLLSERTGWGLSLQQEILSLSGKN